MEWSEKIERKLKKRQTQERQQVVIERVVKQACLDVVNKHAEYSKVSFKEEIVSTIRSAAKELYCARLRRLKIKFNDGKNLTHGMDQQPRRTKGDNGRFVAQDVDQYPWAAKFHAYFERTGEFENDVVDIDVPQHVLALEQL